MSGSSDINHWAEVDDQPGCVRGRRREVLTQIKMAATSSLPLILNLPHTHLTLHESGSAVSHDVSAPSDTIRTE